MYLDTINDQLAELYRLVLSDVKVAVLESRTWLYSLVGRDGAVCRTAGLVLHSAGLPGGGQAAGEAGGGARPLDYIDHVSPNSGQGYKVDQYHNSHYLCVLLDVFYTNNLSFSFHKKLNQNTFY